MVKKNGQEYTIFRLECKIINLRGAKVQLYNMFWCMTVWLDKDFCIPLGKIKLK